MKYDRKKDANFWILARKYLHAYMPVTRNLSNKSVEAYKQALKDYISFLRVSKNIKAEDVTFELLTREYIIDFISYLRSHNLANKSVNLKITAIRSFLKFCSDEDFELRGLYEEIKSIRNLKIEKKPIEYLQENATKAILNAHDTTSAKSRRNRMMLILLYDSGARVQELADINVSSLHLNVKNPYITLTGKGKKTRNVPLLQKTVEHLKKYLSEFHSEGVEQPLFYSYLDNKPHRISTDSISLILKNAADIARKTCVDVPVKKKIHCHLIRKTKAMDLYRNGVPLPFIMQLLGHESMSTTSGFYAFATLEMMTEAIKKSSPEIIDVEKKWKTDEFREVLYSLD